MRARIYGRVAIVGLWFMAACGGEHGGFELTTDERALALVNQSGGDPFDIWTAVQDRSGDHAAAVDDPGICFAKSGFVIFQRDASNKFKSVTWDSSGLPQPGVFSPRMSEWHTWPGPRTFKSKPACANLDAIDSSAPRAYEIVLAGTDSADKLYTSSAQANDSPDGSEPNVPSDITTWSKVSDNTYASGPGIAVGVGKVVIVGRRISDNLIYAHTRSLPYGQGTWSSGDDAPALPQGWTAEGSPTITYTLGGVDAFTVMVRATRPGYSTTFYRAHFDGSAWTGNPVWASVSVCCTVVGDPALEYSGDVNALTLFSLQGSHAGVEVVQTTGLDLQWGTVRRVRPNQLVDVVGAPAALGLWSPYEGERRHTVVARKPDGKMYYTGVNGLVYP